MIVGAQFLTAWFGEHRCCGCRAEVVPGAVVCSACAAGLVPAGVLEPPPEPLADWLALLRYESTGRDLVLALKQGDRRMVRASGRLLAARVGATWCPDVVTWAPTSLARRRQRGYDQAHELARWVARYSGRRARRLLERSAGSGPQHGRTAAQRRTGPQFVALRNCSGSVLVVDDVCTTGSTLRAAAAVLRAAGANDVRAATLAAAQRAGEPLAQGG